MKMNPLRPVLLALAFALPATAADLTFSLQTRDPSTRAIHHVNTPLDPAKTGIVIIDMWNTNDCMTNAQRCAALVPRMNKVLAVARGLGMQIIWAPTDVASQYAGAPQRERAMALPRPSLPHITSFSCPFSANTVRPEKCMCGPGIVCRVHQGWDSMDPNLEIASDDWIVGDPQEIYAIYQQRGLTRLIYMGINTNLCVMNKPEGIAPMTSAGIPCILARDLTDAETSYDPATGFTPDLGTEKDVADIERSGIPTVDIAGEWSKAGAWNAKWIVEKVRFAPWGTKTWPYFFTDSTKVTLSSPNQKAAAIHYTLDGSEPQSSSPLYTKPLELTKTITLRAAAFENGRSVSLPSEGYFVRLGPVPPKPNVSLDQLKPVTPARPEWRWEAKTNLSFSGAPLKIRDVPYDRGFGMRAPSDLLYQIQPNYARFVAQAGIDDDLFRERPQGRFLATYPGVRFQVYIDGTLASESPVMRLGQVPWRFDVPIPPHSRVIDIVATGTGAHSPLDLADWVDAGFVLK